VLGVPSTVGQNWYQTVPTPFPKASKAPQLTGGRIVCIYKKMLGMLGFDSEGNRRRMVDWIGQFSFNELALSEGLSPPRFHASLFLVCTGNPKRLSGTLVGCDSNW
jgi:hypothetical protein